MKLGKGLLIVLVVVLNFMAIFMVIPELLNGNEEYETVLQQAREYNEAQLYEKAMMTYDKVASIDNSLELQIEMAETYYKGFGNGEFVEYYKFSNFLSNMISSYREVSKAYEVALEYWDKFEDYEECVYALYQAEDLGVDSKNISKIREKIRYMCKTNFTSYNDIVFTPDNTYLVFYDGYTFLNNKLGRVTGNRYEYATPMLNGYALVKANDSVYLLSEADVREAYFPKEVTESTGVGEGFIACKVNEIYSYYNLAGTKVFGEYLFASRYANGVAAVYTDKGWQIIDTEGKAITERYYEDVKLSQTNGCSEYGVIIAKENGAYYMYDCQMNKISDNSFEDADVLMDTNGYVAFKKDGKWGYVNSLGKVVIEPKYENAKSFSRGLAGVKNEGYWFFINTDDKVAITGEYDDVSYFNSNGYCFVKMEENWYSLSRLYLD